MKLHRLQNFITSKVSPTIWMEFHGVSDETCKEISLQPWEGGKTICSVGKNRWFFEMMDRQAWEIMKSVGKLQEMHWFCLRREEQNSPFLTNIGIKLYFSLGKPIFFCPDDFRLFATTCNHTWSFFSFVGAKREIFFWGPKFWPPKNWEGEGVVGGTPSLLLEFFFVPKAPWGPGGVRPRCQESGTVRNSYGTI